MAVTFTEKAAGALKARLQALGVQRVRASTFHSAALAPASPLRARRRRAGAAVEGARAPAARKRPAGAVQVPSGGRPRDRDRVGEEPADPARGLPRRRARPRAADSRRPDAPHLSRLRAAEGGRGRDRLRGPARAGGASCSSGTSAAREAFRAQYRAFTVDEYQDVNLLQQALLDLWLGDRDDLCVVGDDYQSIYGFTGASPSHLLGVPQRFPQALVVRLEENYRSTPQVLALANRLVPRSAAPRRCCGRRCPTGRSRR